LHLKKCFSYFALFPEGYRFHNIEITYFWIAIGIIERDDNCMDELVENGFLMKEGDNLSQYYVMHDLFHELSRIVSLQECLNIHSSLSFRAAAIPKSIRHLSITMEDRYDENFRAEMIKLRSKINIVNLRTLMIFRQYEGTIDEILKDTFKEIENLRVLFIAVNSAESFPHKFSKLIHLRYLRIIAYQSSILPRTLSGFYHLQLLDLREWHGSKQLPRNINRLINLRHLFAVHKLHSSVPEVGKMKCLQELKEFRVKKESVGFELRQLGGLTELGGELRICDLEKVATKEEAIDAKLMLKKNLKRLALIWSDIQDTTEYDILDCLEPHPDLGALHILNHGGTVGPPRWLCGDITTKMLKSLHLEGVSWSTLPPFGQLLHLMSLTLRDVSRVHLIKPDMDGLTNISFVHLKRIFLEGLWELTEWVGVPNAHSFPRLESVICKHCPNLCSLPFLQECPGSCANLLSLDISDCPKLSMANMPHTPSLTYISVVNGLHSVLLYDEKYLSIKGYKGGLAYHNLDKVETISIGGVSSISFGDLNRLKSLTKLEAQRSNIMCNGLVDHPRLRTLIIDCCDNFFRWPMGESGYSSTINPLYPTSLRELSVYSVSGMQSLAPISNLTSLTSLRLIDCYNITVDGFNPLIIVNLKKLVVYNTGWGPDSVAADLLSEVKRTNDLLPAGSFDSVAADLLSEVKRTSDLLPAGSFQLETLEVDSISAVLVAPICNLLAGTLNELSIRFDQRVEIFTEEEEKALQLFTSLRTLQFRYCGRLSSLPKGLDTLSSLRELVVRCCSQVHWLPTTSLQVNVIYDNDQE
jgi:Leucine-rich repeat (LRR) protein